MLVKVEFLALVWTDICVWEGMRNMKNVRNINVVVIATAEVKNVGSKVAKWPPITTPIAAPAVTLLANIPITSVNESGAVTSER